MLINSLKLLYFSPTGTTKKVLEGIAAGIGAKINKFIDLNASEAEFDLSKSQTDLVLIGMPTYSGRIAPAGAALLTKLQSDGIPAVLVAVYGNNKFDDILLEMKDITIANGFMPVGAGAFIGEHSFSSVDKPIAAGRPDAKDMEKAQKFGRLIVKKMLEYKVDANIDLKVPGNFPYRQWNKIPAQPPTTDNDLCIKCGKCKDVCPVNAISINETVISNSALCTFCCACVKECPVSARYISDSRLLGSQEKLFSNCSEPKQAELFL